MLVTLAYVSFTIFPIVPVESRTRFAFKIVFMALAANIVGAGLFLTYGFRRARPKGMAS